MKENGNKRTVCGQHIAFSGDWATSAYSFSTWNVPQKVTKNSLELECVCKYCECLFVFHFHFFFARERVARLVGPNEYRKINLTTWTVAIHKNAHAKRKRCETPERNIQIPCTNCEIVTISNCCCLVCHALIYIRLFMTGPCFMNAFQWNQRRHSKREKRKKNGTRVKAIPRSMLLSSLFEMHHRLWTNFLVLWPIVQQ